MDHDIQSQEELDHEYLLSKETSSSSFSEEENALPTRGLHIRTERRECCGINNISWAAIIIHTSIFFTYTIILSVLAYSWRPSRELAGGVAYEPFVPESTATVFQHAHSKYVGAPSEDLDTAWIQLLKNTNVRIHPDEMGHIPGRMENGIELPDGGYYAVLNAYHNLHCIKRLHHYMYEDHYFPNITRRQKAANEFHNHHCLDMLRQTVMCQGDTQLLTMRWRPDSPVPVANWTAPHRCANWDQVEQWAGSRRIANLMEPGYLYHPTLGPAYSEDGRDIIGETLLPETD